MGILPFILAALALLGGLGWLGLRVKPKPFPPYPEKTTLTEMVDLPHDLPAPVARFFKAAIGERVPVITSAVITGRGTIRFKGITMPARWRFTHIAGQGYRHYLETTIFGLPIFKVNEHFLGGKSRLELPFGVVENSHKIDSAANLGLWAESVYLPSIFVTDPRARWEAIAGTTARLIVPFEGGEDSFTATFDPKTGLLVRMEAMRWRDDADKEKILWCNEPYGWQVFHGMKIPSPGGVTWIDEGTPWLVATVEEVVYNVDVSEYIRMRGIQ